MLLLSGRIWNIHVEGNKRNSTPEILTFLEKEGITMECQNIKSTAEKLHLWCAGNIRILPGVSARIQGHGLILTVQEGIFTEDAGESETPCDLSADRTGTIEK